MSRPIVYDATNLIAQMAGRDPSGIDRIDLTYGQHFAFSQHAVFASHYGLRTPHVMSAGMLRHIVQHVRARWREDDAEDSDDTAYLQIKAWLAGRQPQQSDRILRFEHRAGGDNGWRAHLPYLYARLMGVGKSVPHGAIYLTIAEAGLEHHRLFQWLGRRPDVSAIFFVHDFLPLDYPEYFRAGLRALFERRIETLRRWGTAFIVSTNVVRTRLGGVLAGVRSADPPIHVAAFPSPLPLVGRTCNDSGMETDPYFVLVSTIEPRKNHLLALNIWREFASTGDNNIPKLVLVGGQGWEHEQVDDMLDRCEVIRRHVFHSPRLSGAGLAQLLSGAQALLMPSFGEGYGLPIVEALSLGKPVIASDIATFREITQGCATLLSPLDGIGWKEAISAFASRNSPAWLAAREKAVQYRKPDWPSYFKGIETFLASPKMTAAA